MLEGSLLVTDRLKTWLGKDKYIFLDVNNKGCNGNTITWKIIESKNVNSEFTSSCRYYTLSESFFRALEQGLELKVDYIDEPLNKKVQITILNKDKCGCGLSYSV